MHFLVKASPPKWLDVATSNFADALVSSKRIFAMVYHGLKSGFSDFSTKTYVVGTKKNVWM